MVLLALYRNSAEVRRQGDADDDRRAVGDARRRRLHHVRDQRQGHGDREVKRVHRRHDRRGLDLRHRLDERHLRTGNKDFLIANIETMVEFAPWTFAIAMFMVSAFVKSQAATLTIMIPFGLTLGLPISLMLGVMPSSYAYFFFAFYPSDLAAINMDRTGTTRSASTCSTTHS